MEVGGIKKRRMQNLYNASRDGDKGGDGNTGEKGGGTESRLLSEKPRRQLLPSSQMGRGVASFGRFESLYELVGLQSRGGPRRQSFIPRLLNLDK